MEPHGEYSISVINRYIKIEAIGSWNSETMELFIEEFKAKALPLSNDAWGVLVDGTAWELGTPETNQLANTLQLWCVEHNQKYEALVLGESKIKRFQIEQYMQEVPSGSIDYRYFKNIEDATIWLSNLGIFSS